MENNAIDIGLSAMMRDNSLQCFMPALCRDTTSALILLAMELSKTKLSLTMIEEQAGE